MPSDSKEKYLISFSLTSNFIASWLKQFNNNYEHRTEMFCEEMIELFQKIPVTLPKPID